MKNPNAVAAITTASLVIAGEQALFTYTSTNVSAFWQKAIEAAVVTIVLYVGRDGIKGALLDLWGKAKAVWNGPTQPAPAPSAPPPPVQGA